VPAAAKKCFFSPLNNMRAAAENFPETISRRKGTRAFRPKALSYYRSRRIRSSLNEAILHGVLIQQRDG